MIGQNYWRSNKAKAQLHVSKDYIEFVSLGIEHRFERNLIVGIKEYHGPLFSNGIQIVHKRPGYPPFVVFTAFPPRVLTILVEGLEKYGYKVTE